MEKDQSEAAVEKQEEEEGTVKYNSKRHLD